MNKILLCKIRTRQLYLTFRCMIGLYIAVKTDEYYKTNLHPDINQNVFTQSAVQDTCQHLPGMVECISLEVMVIAAIATSSLVNLSNRQLGQIIRDFQLWSNSDTCTSVLCYPYTLKNSFCVAFKIKRPLIQRTIQMINSSILPKMIVHTM